MAQRRRRRMTGALELRDVLQVAAPLGTLALAVWLARQDHRRASDLQQLREATGKERRSRRRPMHGARRRRG